MISNVVSFLPTILGLAWSATTAVPVIECAVRAIWHSGELSANRAQFHTCTVNSLYVEEKNQFIKDIKADFNSKLPTSCLPDANKTEAPKLKLKFVNSDDLEVDRDTFKLFCGTFKTLSSDYSDVEANEFLMPSFFDTEKHNLFFKNYLKDNSNLNLSKLSNEDLIKIYNMAMFLDMPDLEAKCMETIVKRYIKTESTDLKDGLEGLNVRYAKEFNRLFTNVDQLKTGHLSEALVTRLNDFDVEQAKVVKKIVKTALFGLLLTPTPFTPLIVPRLVFTLDFSSCIMSPLALQILSNYIGGAAFILVHHGAPIMPTTHQVISQIYQKFFNGVNLIRNAFDNAFVFTATKIKDASIFIALSIIHAPIYLYNKIGQGLQQIPTAVTAGLIASTILLVAAKTI